MPNRHESRAGVAGVIPASTVVPFPPSVVVVRSIREHIGSVRPGMAGGGFLMPISVRGDTFFGRGHSN